MSAPLSCVVVGGTSSIPSWQITAADAGARTAIGSDATAAWQFAPNEVQPRHAELYFDGASLFVCDLVNQGDVRIGGQAVTAGQWVPVPVGSSLSIGQAVINVQQGQSVPPPPVAKKTSRKSKKPQMSVRTMVLGGVVALALVGLGGVLVFQKLRESAAREAAAPIKTSHAAQGAPRAQTVDHLFPGASIATRERDHEAKRTRILDEEDIKAQESRSQNKLERPEPQTLEGKAATAAIDGDMEKARTLYRELVNEQPSNAAFRVALDLVERQRRERCIELGKGGCE